MSNTVDERIVEARFDSKDFEKGVDRTIKKLDELKQSLNMKDSGKSITDFANDAEKGIEKAGNALERLSNRFTTFTGMLKQQIIGGLVNEISQAFISLERNIAGFVRSISSAQIGQGMNKYTEILNSVRTMTAAGVNQDIAYDKIKRLAEYSDQTSYSLSQMTSGMSKLVAAGMDVDKAEKSMEGLANMAASAGVNIYEAQRAFLNFSQAYGSGKMRIQDWTSFETLNMATEPVMKIFMEAAAQVGTLEKTVDKSGKEIYKTSKKVNKQIKAGKEVATSGFRDTLSYGWLDKATMEQATAVLSYFEDLKIDLNDLSDEELKNFATKAFQAAKEARSFADVMGTIKDVVATGWATSFEFIFGKLDKATEFFTWLTESNLADVIYGIGEFRNEVLSAWGADFLEGGIFHARDLEKGFLGTGRDLLIDALKNIDELIGSINEGIQSLFPETDVGWKQNLTFAQNLGYNLAMLTKNFRTATKNMLDFFTVEEEHNGEKKRVLKPEYVKVLESVGKIFGAIGKAAGAAFRIIGKLEAILGKSFARVLTTVQPVLDAIAGALGRIFDPISQLNENEGFFKSIQNAIDNLLIVIEPLMGPLSAFIGLLGELGSFFVSMTIDTIAMNIDLLAQSLGFIIELFGGTSAQKANEGVGVIEGWANDIKAFGESCKEGFTAIKDFFASLFNDLKVLLGIGEKTEGQEGGFFDNIKNFFDTNEFVQNVKAWINQAIVDIGNWIQGIPAKVSEFATNVGDFFHGLFWMKDENDPSKEVMTPLNAWLIQAIADVKEFFLDLPNKIADGIKNVGSFFETLWNSLFYEEKVDKSGKKTRVKKPLKEWLDQALIDVGNFIKSIPEYVKMGIKGAGNILRTLIGALFGKKDGEEVTGNDIIDTLKKPFEGITFTSILTKIKEIGREIANQIISLFTGTDDWESNKNTLATSVSAGIDWIKTKAEEAWPAVRDWFINLPTEISKVIQGLFGVGEEVEKPIQESIEGEKGPIQTALEDFGKSVGGFIANLPGTIVNFFNTAITEISKLWDMLWKALRGEGEPQAELDENGKVVEKTINEAAPDAKKATSKWEEFTTSLGQTVSNLFSKLPTFIAQGLDGAVILINKALTGLDELLKADNAKQEAKKAGKDAAENAVEETAEGTEDADAKALTEAIHAFGSDLKSLISDKIPTFISDGWTAVKNHAPEWWGIVNTWFDDYDIKGLKNKVTEIGGQIEGVIRGMPDLITTAAEFVKKKFEKKSPLQKAQEEITKQLTDKNGNIINVNAYRYAMKQAAETLSDVPEESAIWKSIKGIGSAIGDALGKVGPDILDGLNNAFKWIGDKVVDFTGKLKEKPDDQPFFEWLTGLIGGENGDNGETSAIAESVKNIGETLKNLIVNIIPSFLGEAFAEIAAGIPRFIQSIFGGGSSSEAESVGKEAGTEIGEQFGNSATQAMVSSFQGTLEKNSASLGSGMDIFSWFTGLFVGTAEAAEADGAEAAVDQISTTIENQEKAIEKSKTLINRQEKINEISKKLNDARADLENAEALGKNDEIDKLTKDIEVYEAQLKKLSEAEGEFVDAKTLDNAPKAQEGMDEISSGLMGFLEVFKNITGAINGFANSNVLGTVAIVAGIIYVMHALKDMLSITDEVEGFGYTAKWEAIKIAIMGLVAMLAWIGYLSAAAANDPNDKRLDKTTETLDKMVGFVERIGTILAILAGLSLGSNIAEIFQGKGAGGGGNWFTTLFAGVFSKLAEIGIFTVGTDALSGSLESLFDSITNVFDELGQGVESFVSFIDPAISGLASMADKLDQAIAAVGKIADLMTAFYNMIGVVGISVAETDEGTKAFMAAAEMLGNDDGTRSAAFLADELERRMTFVFQLTAMMKNLAESLKTFQEVEDAEAQVEKALKAVNLKAFEDFVKKMVTIIYSSLTTTFGSSMVNLDSAAIGFEMLANAFTVFNTAIKGMNMEEVGAFEQSLKVLDGLAATLADASGNSSNWHKILFGDKSLSKYGKEIKMFGGYLQGFFIKIGSLTGTTGNEEELKKTQQRIDLVLTIAQGMAKAANLLATFGGVENLEFLGQKLEGFGSNLGAFIRQVNVNMGEGIDLEKIQIIATGVQSLAELMKGIGAMGDMYPEDIGGLFSAFMQAVSENLASGDNNLFKIGNEAGSQLDAGLAEGINTGAAIAAAEALAGAIKGEFVVSWQIHSPSKVFAGIGKNADEGLQKGIDDNSDKPIGSAADLSKEVLDAMTPEERELYNIQKMWKLGLIDGKTANEQSQKIRDQIARMASEIRETTDEESKEIEKSLEKHDFFSFFGTLFHNLAKANADTTSITPEIIGQEEEKTIVDSLTNTYENVKKIMKQLAKDYTPNFMEALTDTGLLQGQWNKEDTVQNLCNIMGGILKDVSAYSDNEYVDFACDMVGDILNNVKAQADGTGGDMVGGILQSVLKHVSNFSDSAYVDIASMLLSGMLTNMQNESEATGQSLLQVLFGHLKEDAFASFFNLGPQLLAGLFGGGNVDLFGQSPIGTAIEKIKELSLGDMEINPTITPVVDMTNVDEALKTLDLFNQNRTGSFRFNTSGMNTSASEANPTYYGSTPDYKGILDTISSTLSTISGSSSTTVETSLDGVRIVLDSGALVGALIGEIDTILARRGFYAEREG